MGAAVIALPERLDRRSVEAMHAQLAEADGADAVLFQGVPGRFCLGMDFAEATASGIATSGELRRNLEGFSAFMEAVLTAPRPTLAVIDGPALGGGLGIAAACDCVLASERSRFALPEALYGLAPAIIRPALMTRLTLQKLNLLLFTCHSRGPEEAQSFGLVDRIAPASELESATREIVRQFKRARSETVRTARNWHAAGFAAALRSGTDDTHKALSQDGVIAALRAAIADEDPPWSR